MPWLPAFSFVVGTGSVDGLAAGFDGVVVVTRLGAVVVVGVDAVVGGLAGWSLPPEKTPPATSPATINSKTTTAPAMITVREPMARPAKKPSLPTDSPRSASPS